MNSHASITDDELLLYYYRDGLDPLERERIGTALIAQPELASRLQILAAQLDVAAAIPDTAVPPQAQQRWHAALDRAAANEAARSPKDGLLNRLRWPALAAIAAASLVIAFRLGMHLTTELSDPKTATARASRCDCGLKWHLASVERQLAGLADARGEERAALLDALIAQNRIYAMAAERGGDQRLAGALRSFTPILERLANTALGNDDSGAEVAQLNFELRVMQARLAAEADTFPAPSSVAL